MFIGSEQTRSFVTVNTETRNGTIFIKKMANIYDLVLEPMNDGTSRAR
jgi:hypothetical protein